MKSMQDTLRKLDEIAHTESDEDLLMAFDRLDAPAKESLHTATVNMPGFIAKQALSHIQQILHAPAIAEPVSPVIATGAAPAAEWPQLL